MSEQTMSEEQNLEQDVSRTDALEAEVKQTDATDEVTQDQGTDGVPEADPTGEQDDSEQVEESADQEPEENPNAEAAKYRHRLRETETQLEEATARLEASTDTIMNGAIRGANPEVFWALYEGDKTDFINSDGSVDIGKLAEASRELSTKHGIMYGVGSPEESPDHPGHKDWLKQQGIATSRFVDAFRPRTQPRPAPEAPEAQGKGGEAARYRRQLRATESQLAAVQAQHEGMIDTVVENALPKGLEPRVFWALYGGQRSDLLDKHGAPDFDKILKTGRQLGTQHGLIHDQYAEPKAERWNHKDPRLGDYKKRPQRDEGKMTATVYAAARQGESFASAYAPQRNK